MEWKSFGFGNGLLAARAVAESLQQWGNFLFYHISFSGFFRASGDSGTKEEGEERRGLQNLVIIYQQMHSADPNFGQKISRTTENWHMDLYGLIF